MAYVAGKLSLLAYANGFGLYHYDAATDTLATVMASGYFNNTDDNLNLAAADCIFVDAADGHEVLRVDTVSSGTVTTEIGFAGSQWVTVSLADVSTASSAYVAAPFDGYIRRFKTILQGAITVADATVQLELADTLVTGTALTVANASSAAGDVDEGTATAANAVTEGTAVEFTTDGGSTTAAGIIGMIEFVPA